MTARRLSLAIRALRVRRGWRQVDLAARAGVSRWIVSRMERGRLAGIDLETLERIVVALGARLDVIVRWEGEGLDRLLDEGRAALVEIVVRWLTANGWQVAVEVSFLRYGERGSIDVLAWHPGRPRLLVIEVKSVTPDQQRTWCALDPRWGAKAQAVRVRVDAVRYGAPRANPVVGGRGAATWARASEVPRRRVRTWSP